MTKSNVAVTIWGIILNIFLFIIKLIAGIISGSLALISDALNSLTDIFSSTAVFIAVKVSNKKADESHPFGHYRAQPLAAFTVAIFVAIFGFEIIKMAIESFFHASTPNITIFTIAVPIITIIIKALMSYYFTKIGNRTNSPAIRASGIDSKNDMYASSIVLLSMIGSFYNIRYVDSIAAIIISFFIFKAGWDLAIENMSYLVGKSPPKEYIDKIKKIVKRIKGIKGINDVRAHYVGSTVHIEIHIEVNKNISTKKSHSLGKKVQFAVENQEDIDKAFIHIDPV